MHLKRIRLYGFKSFAQDTIVELEPGVTALVGPNGGGKSNVVDAVRWALGEQRLRDLRAERWEDLLHQGGPGRPAARMAEVSLEFDNGDGEMAYWPESLTISRRYYRSGDSDYLVNGQSVRLKDVTDLFLDSGLGRFSYAIISQGRVEGALLQKPLERLEQLEEAAGVSRYKVRKRETLLHLKETEDKLVRLADVADEVGRQMEEVRERADAEARYRTWELLRKDWQARVALTEYRRAMDKRERLDQQLVRLGEERRELTEELGRIVHQSEDLRQRAQSDSAALDDEAGRLRELTQAETALAIQRSELESRMKHLAQERESLTGQLAVLARQRAELAEEMPQPNDPTDLDAQGVLDALGELRARYAAAQTQLDDSRHRRQGAQDRLSAIVQERHQAEQRLARLEGLLGVEAGGGDLSGVMRERQAQAQHLEHQVGQLAQEVARFTEERTRLKSFVAALDQELYGLKHQLAGRQARLRALHQLDAEGAGLSPGVRAVLRGQQEGRLNGVRGTLASLIQSPPDLMLAVETALGGAHQDLVTETERDAQAAVNFLKRGSLGRATFLPLDTVRAARVAPDDYRQFGHEAGVLGWASDLVQAEAAIRPAVQHVLGRVLIVQSLDDAARLGRVHQFRYKMVTLDGQVVHAGGAITGGSRHQGQTQQQRRIELEELTRRIREDSEVVASKEDLLQSSRQEADDVDQQLDAARELLAEHRHRWQQMSQALALHTELHDADGLSQALVELDQAASEQQDALGEADAAVKAVQASLNQLAQELAGLEQQASQYEQQQRERDLIAGRIVQETERLAGREAQQVDRLAAIAVEELEGRDLLVRIGADLERAQEAVRTYEGARAARILALNQRRQTLADLESRQRVLELEDRKMEQRANTWTQERLELLVRFESYQPPENVQALSKSEEENARREIVRITESLNTLGPVVPGSLAVFEQLKERQQFLERESQDVQEARAELLATLREIDEEMNRRVQETAARVERAFSEACRQLYGGGEGGFSWVDGENGGVDLWVRPVGKRPSHLALLSGGEKALGGIAWLFSLLAVRPSPFVVLDEVEASLDEANAVRFAQYLHVARGTTQYVIVTHQRQTMEAADALWGVAGDGHGQSRLVSVRLADVDEQVSS